MSASFVAYEWVVETLVGEENDVEDLNFFDAVPGEFIKAQRYAEQLRAEGLNVDIGLVRDRGNDEDGLLDRQWAYIEEGRLPERFEDTAGVPCAKVPEKFRNEVKRTPQYETHPEILRTLGVL